MSQQRLLTAVAFAALFLLPMTASADMLAVYARGHGSYLKGPVAKISYFENNAAGLGYGFAVGAELAQIDLFLDANFHPEGSAWNQLGIGFDMDLVPGPVFVEPSAQLIYFFGKQHDGSEGIKGLFPRVGVQVGIEFAKLLYVGAESWFGYIVSLPDPEAGPAFMTSAYLGVRFSAL